MPELPEVETVRRGLEPVMAGRRIVGLDQRRADLRFPFPENFAERLTGRRIERIERRAKYLMAVLDKGEILAMHLGMTGRFSIELPAGSGGRPPMPTGFRPPTWNASSKAAAPDVGGLTPSPVGGLTSSSPTAIQLGEFTYDAGHDPTHDHVVFRMEGGATVTYNDARRFGYMSLVGHNEIATHPHFKDLGVEPLGPDLTADYIARMAEGRRSDLKAFLLDQRIIAGLGNIYVCEALFRAKLNPNRAASVLAKKGGKPNDRTHALLPHIRAVLEKAIDAGGSTLRDYRHTDGSLGYFQHTFSVYGREGEPCTRGGCAGIIRRIVQAGRSTFHCPKCQR